MLMVAWSAIKTTHLSNFKSTSFSPNSLFYLSNHTFETTDISVNTFSDHKIVVIKLLEFSKAWHLVKQGVKSVMIGKLYKGE
jgi:hypothetical protein